MHDSIFKCNDIGKTANEFKYRWKVWKYLCFAYGMLETKFWWLRLKFIGGISFEQLRY